VSERNRRQRSAGSPRRGSGRSTFVAKKQPTPTWILVTFIGVPSLIIVILAGLIVKNLVSGKSEEPAQVADYNTEYQSALKLYQQAVEEEKLARRLSQKGSSDQADRLLTSALKKLGEAQRKVLGIVEELKRRLGVEELPVEYGGYNEFLTKIVQRRKDIISMKGFGLKRR